MQNALDDPVGALRINAALRCARADETSIVPYPTVLDIG